MTKDTRKKQPERPIDRLGLVIDHQSKPEEALKFLLAHFKGEGGGWQCYEVTTKSRKYCWCLFITSVLSHRWLRKKLQGPSSRSIDETTTFSLMASDPLYGTMVKYYYDFKNKSGRYKSIPPEFREGIRAMFIPRSSKGGGRNSRIELGPEVTGDNLHFWTLDDFPPGILENEKTLELPDSSLTASSLKSESLDHLLDRLYKTPEWKEWEENAKQRRQTARRASALARIRDYLRQEALRDLLEHRLRSKQLGDYVHLRLLVGTVPQPDEAASVDDKPSISRHGRTWTWFNDRLLLNPIGQYAISSPVGAGKSTFLRYLQADILNGEGPLAVYLTAAEIASIKHLSWPRLRDYLAETFCEPLERVLTKKQWNTELDRAFRENHLLFLIDGLDQLGNAGLNCSGLVDRMISLVRDNPIIMAGRPTAIRWLESKPEVTLLRLEPFDEQAQEQFFGNSYEDACRVCRRNANLLGVPILAYLIRLVVQGDVDNSRPIRSRWELYSRLVEYFFYEHAPNIQRQDHEEWVAGVTEALGRVAYGAVDRPDPIWSAIPQKVCRDLLQSTPLSLDAIPSCGLVDIVAADSKPRTRHLVFGHQSFQEFFAAEWARSDQKRLGHVLSEYWNPKWHEVIKFLSGTEIGESIVNTIYPDANKDNSLHSRLFFVAKCAGEVSLSHEVESRLTQDIHAMIDTEPFPHNAVKALVQLRTTRSQELAWDMIAPSDGHWMSSLLRDPEMTSMLHSPDRLDHLLETGKAQDPCIFLNVLRLWGEKRPSRVIDQALSLLHSRENRTRFMAACVIGTFASRLGGRHVERIWNMLGDDDPEVRGCALDCLGSYDGDIPDTVIDRVFALVDDSESSVSFLSLRLLSDLSGRMHTKHSQALITMLLERSELAHRDVLFTFPNFTQGLPPNQLVQIENALFDEDPDVLVAAMSLLRSQRSRVSRRAVNRVLELTNHESVYSDAIGTASSISSSLSKANRRRIVEFLYDERPGTRSITLLAVPKLADEICSDDLPVIVDALEDRYLRITAVRACVSVAEKLEPVQISRVIDSILAAGAAFLPMVPSDGTISPLAPYLSDEQFEQVFEKAVSSKEFVTTAILLEILEPKKFRARHVKRLQPLMDAIPEENTCRNSGLSTEEMNMTRGIVCRKLRELHALGLLEGSAD